MQVNPTATGHQWRKACRAMHVVKLQQKAVSNSAAALDKKFYAYGEELERVKVIKYLGRLVAFDDNLTQAVWGNLKKALLVRARISRVLRADNVSARLNGMFYKATVQAVLLFGIETWVFAPTALQRLEGFHVKAARQMTSMLPKL